MKIISWINSLICSLKIQMLPHQDVFSGTTQQGIYCKLWYLKVQVNVLYRPDGRGDWSDEGIEIIDLSKRSSGSVEENNTLVQYTIVCNSSHLTPFVVLVDAHGVLEQARDYVTNFHSLIHTDPSKRSSSTWNILIYWSLNL